MSSFAGATSTDEVLKHNWFRSFTWQRFMYRKLKVPWTPDLIGPSDTSYFENFADEHVDDHDKRFGTGKRTGHCCSFLTLRFWLSSFCITSALQRKRPWVQYSMTTATPTLRLLLNCLPSICCIIIWGSKCRERALTKSPHREVMMMMRINPRKTTMTLN